MNIDTIKPQKLAIYYGWPSAVNGAGGNVNNAVQTYKNYDLLVLGQGLELATHPDHLNTVSIISHTEMVNTLVFGYIDAVLPIDDIQDKIELWAAMGVKGIFLDQFGYDFGVSREKQRAIIWSVHHYQIGSNRLSAFVNAWNPDDAFSSNIDAIHNPLGKSTKLNETDWYLAESFAIKNGNYDDDDTNGNTIKDWQDKAIKLTGPGGYRQTYGTKIAAVTTNDFSSYDQNKTNYSYYASVINLFDAWGWGEEFFSASSAQLPFRDRPLIIGTYFTHPINIVNGILERQTNIGVHIDTNNHTTSTLLD